MGQCCSSQNTGPDAQLYDCWPLVPHKMTYQEAIAKYMKEENFKKDNVSLGVIRLDYNYPPAPGDIDCPDTYAYKVFYHAVPGLTFKSCQENKLDNQIKKNLDKALNELITEKKVLGITGDCGFMMYYQNYVRNHKLTHTPVFMSALA